MRTAEILCLGFCVGLWAPPLPMIASEIDEAALRQLSEVESSDQPGTAAGAWAKVAAADVEQLPRILAAIDSGKPLAANWLRAAVDTISERALANRHELPVDKLVAFIRDTSHDPQARRLAFEWLRRVKPEQGARMIAGMLQDPSVELRREAVALRIESGNQLESNGQLPAAISAYQEGLSGARDEDQVKELAKRLRGLDQKLDLPKHFGFIQKWKLIGPFDNSNQVGLDNVYPPEIAVDLQGEYAGKDARATWHEFQGEDDFGMIDMNKTFGKLKEVTGYAWTEFYSDRQQDVELRLGCKNAWKLWVNGELLFRRNEYHRGMQMDQYRIKATLKPGRNEILFKLCQNEQVESWTVEWQFQLRVCDATGTAIHSAPTPKN